MDQKLNGAKRRIDPVADAIDEVRADLAARRAAGEIPELPPGELERQFSAVVEAADGLLRGRAAPRRQRPGAPRRDGDMGTAADRAPRTDRRSTAAGSGRAPSAPSCDARSRRGRTARPTSSSRSSPGRTACSAFLGRVHLDRVRSLEYRVAELEREVERLRPRRRPGTRAVPRRSDARPAGRRGRPRRRDHPLGAAAPRRLAKLGPANVYAQFREPGVLDVVEPLRPPRRSTQRRPAAHLPREHGLVAGVPGADRRAGDRARVPQLLATRGLHRA